MTDANAGRGAYPFPMTEPSAPPRGAAAVPFILMTVLLDVLTLGLILPVLPALVKAMPDAGGVAAPVWLGVLMAAFGLTQFVCAPVLGALSDRFGRRPVLLVSLAGQAADGLLLALAPTMAWLFAGRVIAGLTAANITAANAYIADVTPPQRRAAEFGKIGAVFGLGFVLGPMLGGFLGEYGERLPFFAAAALSGLNFLYGLCVLPESLPASLRRPFSWARANPVGSLLNLGRSELLPRLVTTLACLGLASGILHSMWAVYGQERLAWTPADVGLSLAAVGVCVGAVQGGLTGVFVKWIGERRTVLAGLTVDVAAFVLIGLSTETWMMYASIPLMALAGAAGPAMQAILSKGVGPDEQGEIQGAVGSLMSLTECLAPPLGGFLMASFSGPEAPADLPGMPFLFAAGLLLLGLGFAARALRPVRRAAEADGAAAPAE